MSGKEMRQTKTKSYEKYTGIFYVEKTNKKKTKKKQTSLTTEIKEINQDIGVRRETKKIPTQGQAIQTKQDIPK